MFRRGAHPPQINNQTADDQQTYTLPGSVPQRECFSRPFPLIGGWAKIVELVELLHSRLNPQPANQGHGKQSHDQPEVY